MKLNFGENCDKNKNVVLSYDRSYQFIVIIIFDMR